MKSLFPRPVKAVILAVLALSSVSDLAVASPEAPPADKGKNTCPETNDFQDIIVTARRRNETALDTPVVLSAFSGDQLSRLAITSISDVGKLTPLLIIAPSGGPYGGNLTLRGVASPSANASSEPAVTINIDGVPVSYGGVTRLTNIDLGQVEVLKGPQALFFGKNSSGGIVSIHSGPPQSCCLQLSLQRFAAQQNRSQHRCYSRSERVFGACEGG